MDVAIELTTRVGVLLFFISVCHVIAQRLRLPDPIILTGAGVAIGFGYIALQHFAPAFAANTIAPFLSPAMPPEAYLWIFLPPILFQAAMEVDTSGFVADLAPILLLAVGAVLAATLSVGAMAYLTSGQGFIVCLLLGAIVSTTDPATVISLFQSSGAPARLIRLVEGESLFNDAAAIAITTLLTGAISALPASRAESYPVAQFLLSLLGGCAVGGLIGVLFVFVSGAMRSLPFAEYSLSLALPNLIYPFAERVLHVSGVAAVVCAGLVVGRIMLARRPASHVNLFRDLWRYQATLASAAVLLLATAHVPAMLDDLRLIDIVVLLLVLAAAVASRLGILSVCMPMMSRIGICKPLPMAHQLLIAWGGVRGPVTLTLAICLARNQSLAPDTRHFAAAMAAGFVLLNLFFNGLTLKYFARKLGVLTPENRPRGASDGVLN
ncbi:MAG: cation:proton antiporter [Dyella sp.]|nr:cation:proton antiporter [Dyella sp.]